MACRKRLRASTFYKEARRPRDSERKSFRRFLHSRAFRPATREPQKAKERRREGDKQPADIENRRVSIFVVVMT